MLKQITHPRWYLKRKRRKANIRSGGHSQYGQDIVVWELLNKQSNGIFLDIGANDGKSLSNTLLFEEKGWSGICVEPNPSIFEKLKENRKCHLVNACIADTDGTVDFLSVEGPANMLSGILAFCDDHHLNRIDTDVKELGGTKQVLAIETLKPQTLLSRFGLEQIDFLSIDAEGADIVILSAFDFDVTPVHVITVENNRTPAVYDLLTRKGFRLMRCVGCDEIYQNLNFLP